MDIVNSATNEERTATTTESKPTVTVMIPTYRKNDYFDQAIQSVLEQTYPQNLISVYVCVNGNDTRYYEELVSQYRDNDRVTILWTEKQSLSEGRNRMIDALETECATFLDDDDWFTPGYIEELASHYRVGVDIVVGKVNNWDGSTVDEETYINKALCRLGEGTEHEIQNMNSVLTTAWCKLFSSEKLKSWKRMDATLKNTEDVIFWMENVHRIKGEIYLCNVQTEEAYMRRLTPNSMSRPKKEDEYRFFVDERLMIMKRIEQKIFDDSIGIFYKVFYLNQITSQGRFIIRYYEKCDEETKQRIRAKIQESNLNFLNYSWFGEKKGIAFCHNFAPFVDASAYVATKRLKQISDDFGKLISWRVLMGNMSNQRPWDWIWRRFFAVFQYSQRSVIGKKTYWNEQAQSKWAMNAFKRVEDEKADVIYSRSMWPGSHLAALKYKEKYPDAFWYAEFSDPLYMTTDNRPRKVAASGTDGIDDNFYKNIEANVMKNADVIIFTNSNQKEYMLKSNDALTGYENKRICCWHHSILPPEYAHIVQCRQKMNPAKINVGYFGTFYANRSYKELLQLLTDDRIEVYMYTTMTEELRQIQKEYKNLKIFDMVSMLETLSIMRQLDYCIVNDIEFEGRPIPYLPSKMADYLCAANKIIAIIRDGSPMSKLENDKIVKTYTIDEEFCSTLKKQV